MEVGQVVLKGVKKGPTKEKMLKGSLQSMHLSRVSALYGFFVFHQGFDDILSNSFPTTI